MDISFKGVYTLNANQYLPKKESDKRDKLLGFFSAHSVNGQELRDKFIDFDSKVKRGVLHPTSSCELTFDIRNEKTCVAFEEAMSKVGQSFTKIA